MKLHLDHHNPQLHICYVGEKYLKVECMLVSDPEDLAWLVDAEDVPAPRLALAFERDGAGQTLVRRASRPCHLDTVNLINREVAKFLEGFEACSRAHRLSDAYSFYFHYNLALGRLARLVQISRHKAEKLYLPAQLTNTRLRPGERQEFIDLAGSLYLPEANERKRRLAAKFIEFFEELAQSHKLDFDANKLRIFLNAIVRRDFFVNVRDWAEQLDGWIRPGVLIRASTLTRWEKEEELRRWMRELKVRQIIDLRGDSPRDGKPYPAELLEGIEYVRHPMAQVGHMDENDRAPHYLATALHNLPTIVGVLRKIAAASGCSVVHCYVGVDRTGIVMALLGELLGVPRELLVRDYVASGGVLHGHSLSKFLEGIDEQGGAATILNAAGLDKTTISALRERLLSPQALNGDV
jgi:protein-tyrosine phosphatase